MKAPERRNKSNVPQTEVATEAAMDSLQKAAIIMMTLDEERSQRLIGMMEETEIRSLSRAMATLGRAEATLVEKTIGEFQDEIGKTANLFGNVENTERMLRRVMSAEKVAEIMDDIRGPDGRNMWEKLANISPEVMATYLRNEHPQTAAVILAKLPGQHAAKILRQLPETLVNELSLRLVRMDNVQRSTLVDIEETLKREFMTNLSRSYERDSAAIVADMLNRSDPQMVERVMRQLELQEPHAAARIRRIMFTFDDLIRVDPDTFGVLIADCPLDKLPVALSGANPEIKELFLSNMSARAAAMLREEIESLPNQRRKVVEDAQAEIIAITRRLAESGKIFILDDGEGDEEE